MVVLAQQIAEPSTYNHLIHLDRRHCTALEQLDYAYHASKTLDLSALQQNYYDSLYQPITPPFTTTATAVPHRGSLPSAQHHLLHRCPATARCYYSRNNASPRPTIFHRGAVMPAPSRDIPR